MWMIVEDDGDLNKYFGVELGRCTDGSTHTRQPLLTQRIINFILGMDKESDKPTPVVNTNLEKRGISTK